MRKWHKGFPPHTGWWYTKFDQCIYFWRWFDAENQTWSVGVPDTYTPEQAARWAAQKGAIQTSIEWSNYWPENARVPRIDPRRTK